MVLAFGIIVIFSAIYLLNIPYQRELSRMTPKERKAHLREIDDELRIW